MAGAVSRSLLDYLAAPVVVGDPDGQVVYLNSAFEARFSTETRETLGRPLASLFEGGAREAVLRAVAGVCSGAGSMRFRLREGDTRYAAMASPIVDGPDRVGVMILFVDELATDEQILTFHRDVQGSLDEITRCLMGLTKPRAGVLDSETRSVLEDGIRALERIRKRADELGALLQQGSRKS